MIFSSYTFVLVFLPAVLAGYAMLQRLGHSRVTIAWLVLASFVFYGWWNPIYLVLIGFSILFNYTLGLQLGGGEGRHRKLLMLFGVAVNLGLLGYFKYAGFFVNIIDAVSGADWRIGRIVLPLAISFFTFQQIAYLVDAYRHVSQEHDFLDYCLFVTFFPQLIAGPIVHHHEMLPQFREPGRRMRRQDLSIGSAIFVFGMAKKVLVADELAPHGDEIFALAGAGHDLTFAQAWTGVLAYTMQLYFDFSGYSDMAIGLGRLFGIRLPMNFNSPYKSVSVIEFWGRWHITLSRFLRDYLYIPLGGNRKGKARRYVNLVLTMLLGGLWHGAGWTFVVWGGLHGLYLCVNHAWRAMTGSRGKPVRIRWRIPATALTFLAVCIGWVFFRAESFDAAGRVLGAMMGSHGWSLADSGLSTGRAAMLWGMLAVVFIMPNTQQIMHRFKPILAMKLRPEQPRWLPAIEWKPDVFWSVVMAILTIACLLQMSRVSTFIYYQF